MRRWSRSTTILTRTSPTTRCRRSSTHWRREGHRSPGRSSAARRAAPRAVRPRLRQWHPRTTIIGGNGHERRQQEPAFHDPGDHRRHRRARLGAAADLHAARAADGDRARGADLRPVREQEAVMALLKPEFVEAHPVKAGLAWAAAFAPMLAAVMIVTGSKPTLSWILDLIALSVS